VARTTAPHDLRGLAQAETSLTATLSEAVRPLRPALRRLKVRDIELETAILSRVGGGGIAHAGVRLRRPLRETDLYLRPHVLGCMATTQALTDRVTEAVLSPGAYVVQLRPLGGLDFAFDLLDAKGQRVIAVPAHGGPSQKPSGGTTISFCGIDIEINNPDKILNPFKHLVCLSFIHWSWCFTVPKRK
jgi:hypothetical protein